MPIPISSKSNPRPNRGARRALYTLATLAVLAALDVAGAILVPVVFALLAAVMLYPLLVALHRDLRIPFGLGAAILVFGLLATLTLGALLLSAPVSEMASELPEQIREIEYKLRGVRDRIDELKEAGKKIEDLTETKDDDSVRVQVTDSRVTSVILGQTGFILSNGFLTVGLIYFLLASHNIFVYKLIRVLPRKRHQLMAMRIFRRIKNDISQYFLTITTVNIALGVAVGLTMWAFGMPSPLLWGVMAATFNFVPFLGAVVGVIIIAIAATTQFDDLTYALLVPAAYYALTALEGTIITPLLLGRRMVLNPVVVFLSLIFWGWLWGIPGIFLAVPLMSMIKIICDYSDPLRPIGVFLGR